MRQGACENKFPLAWGCRVAKPPTMDVRVGERAAEVEVSCHQIALVPLEKCFKRLADRSCYFQSRRVRRKVVELHNYWISCAVCWFFVAAQSERDEQPQQRNNFVHVTLLRRLSWDGDHDWDKIAWSVASRFSFSFFLVRVQSFWTPINTTQ